MAQTAAGSDRVDAALRRALVELGSATPLSEVTASALVRKSGIGRTTFYRRHANAARYIESVREQLLTELEGAFAEAQREAPRDSGLYRIMTQRTRELLITVEQNADVFQLLWRGTESSTFPDRCRDLLANLLGRDFETLGASIDTAYCPPEYVLAFLAHALFGVLRTWLAKPQPDPIDDMAFYLASLMSGNTADFLTQR